MFLLILLSLLSLVPSHISYVLLELLKNSMRATVEKHGTDTMPAIRIVIADGEDNEDVVIKVSIIYRSINLSNDLSIYHSSLYPSISLSIYPSIYLSI
jgi:hypothetical protein